MRVLIFDGNLKAFGGKFVLAWTWRLTFFLLHVFISFFVSGLFAPGASAESRYQVPYYQFA